MKTTLLLPRALQALHTLHSGTRLSLLLCSCMALPAFATVTTLASLQPVAVTPHPAWGTTGLLQAAFGLALVIASIFLCAWVARRLGLQKANNRGLVNIVASTAIGQRERVVVVDIGGTWLALGVTPGHIHPLHTMPAQALPTDTDPPIRQTANAFAQKLRESLGKK